MGADCGELRVKRIGFVKNCRSAERVGAMISEDERLRSQYYGKGVAAGS